MTEQKHTPEPWKVNQIEQSHACNEFGVEISGADGEVIADNQLYYPAAITEANARRIVAAINYCQGLDTTCMEIDTATGRTPSVTIPNLTDRVFELEAQRDQLRAALENVVDAWSSQFERQGHMAPEWCKQARTALAATEGV